MAARCRRVKLKHFISQSRFPFAFEQDSGACHALKLETIRPNASVVTSKGCPFACSLVGPLAVLKHQLIMPVLCLFMLIPIASTLVIDMPSEEYTGHDKYCKRPFLEKKPFDAQAGIDTTKMPRHKKGTEGLISVRAVYYAPRPVGAMDTLNYDLYADEFAAFHERDLAIMSDVMKANAVRLAPWDTQRSHARFLEACRRHKLFVIPTFDFGFFFSYQVRALPFYERQNQVWKGFKEFVSNAKLDAGEEDDLLLMWSLNYGLNLNETSQGGKLSENAPNALRDEYFELLRVVRELQWVLECGGKGTKCEKSNYAFPRPLAIPLRLDSQNKFDDVGWYVGFAESEWGTWPTDRDALGIDEDQFTMLRRQGAFDAWILETQPPTRRDAMERVIQGASALNASEENATGTFVWHNVSTQTTKDMSGKVMNNCEDGCAYRTQKLVLMQYGFAAQTQSSPTLQLQVDAGLQQKYLNDVFKALNTSAPGDGNGDGLSGSCAHGTTIIMEWTDDWSTSQALGCGGSAYTHPQTGLCDEVQPHWTVRHEWFGLNGQYTFLMWHCIDPRYHQKHPTVTPCDKEAGNNDTVGKCAFRFDRSSMDHEDQFWGSYCVLLGQRNWRTYLTVFLVAVAICFELANCCIRRKGRTAAQPLGRVEVSQPPVRVEATRSFQTLSAVAKIVIPAEIQAEDGLADVSVRLTAQQQRESSRAKLSEETLRLHVESHTKVQSERLWKQIESETLAVQEERVCPAYRESEHKSDCRNWAVVNIHARVLEGYLAWLDSQSHSMSGTEECLQGIMGGGQTTPRPMWMLFAEAALLRIMESLSEHVVHAPELLALLYHEVRWKEIHVPNDVTGQTTDRIPVAKDGEAVLQETVRQPKDPRDAKLPERLEFVVNYDVLHAGLEAFQKNANPYTGGVNFDDMNDYGEAQIGGYKEMGGFKKTFVESQSWFVLVDIVSNFHTLFTIKSWLFFLAWYCNLFNSDREEGAEYNWERRSNTLQLFCFVDMLILLLLEGWMLVHGLRQRRSFRQAAARSRLRKHFMKWLWRRLFTLLVGLLSLAVFVGLFHMGADLCDLPSLHSMPGTVKTGCQQLTPTRVCIAYILLRIITFTVVQLNRRVPFVRGSVDMRKLGQVQPPPLQPPSLRSSSEVDMFRSDSQSGTVVNSFMTVVHDEEQPRKQSGRNLTPFTTVMVWTAVLVICFVVEYFLVVPMISGIGYEDFCGPTCENIKYPWSVKLGIMELHFLPSSCLACVLSIGITYALVVLTAVLDIHFVFHIINGIGGYAMGEGRGLRNVLSLALRHIDLNSNVCRHKQGVHAKDIRTILTDGRAMEAIFGSSWRVLWSRTVESLYEECVISKSQANHMVRAASTQRFNGGLPLNAKAAGPRDEQTAGSAPGEEFTQVRFKAVALRGNSWRRAGQTCCISALQVQSKPLTIPKSYDVTENKGLKKAKKAGFYIRSDAELKLLKTALDENLIVISALKDLNIEKGWQLIGVESAPEQGSSSSGKKESETLAENDIPRTDPRVTRVSNASDNLLEQLDTISSKLEQPTLPYGHPYVLTFVDPSEFLEFVVRFDQPRRVHAISFSTGADETAFDPVRWEVDGSVDPADCQEPERNWRRLQTQELDYDTPLERNAAVDMFFATEPWRFAQPSGSSAQPSGSSSIDLKDLPSAASERLCFFTSSLRGLLLESKYPVRPGKDPLFDSSMGNFPSLTQIIPVFEEQVIASEEFLQASDGRSTNLAFIISQCEEEWHNFAQKHGIESRELYAAFANGELRDWCQLAKQQGKSETEKELSALILQVRLWASDRSQSLARTVAGAIKYHEALKILPCVQEGNQAIYNFEPGAMGLKYDANGTVQEVFNGKQAFVKGVVKGDQILKVGTEVFSPDAVDRAETIGHQYEVTFKVFHPSEEVGKLVQLIIAHQTYGKKGSTEEVDKRKKLTDSDVRQLLRLYKDYPVYLVIDFEAKKTRKDLQRSVMEFLYKEFKFRGTIQYASVLLKYNHGYIDGDPEETIVKIVSVLPRCYPLVLSEQNKGGHGQKTQGKAANQLGALRFACGHYLQMMDANMGAFFGEACKVPFALRRFQPPGTDRRLVKARILGFREHIFTGKHGAVGEAMADAEWSFGTICQRFLAGLGARMHYGHPDFFDAFWASNRGSVSKASPLINLSEDIFAGFNVMMRGERSKHVDFLEWEKGREVSFNKASQFFTKVSSGNVGVMRSRDLLVMTENLSFSAKLSFYFASIGFYLCNLLVDISMQAYILVFIMLTLASKSLDDIGKLGSMLAVEWIISFGLFAMIPRLMEMTLEYGVMEGLVRFIPTIPTSVLMFAFQNKTTASAVSKSIQSGDANYVSTGRVNSNTHYGWKESYLLYRESHYYPAVRVFLLYTLYRFLAKTFGQSALPMIVLNATAAIWIIAPILFCPQPSLHSIRDDLSEFWNFCIGSGNEEDAQQSSRIINLEDSLATKLNDTRANLHDVWLKDRLKHKRDPIFARLFELFCKTLRLALMSAVVYALMVDHVRIVFLLFMVNFFILTLWRLFNRPSVFIMLTFAFWLTVAILLYADSFLFTDAGAILVAFFLTFEALAWLEQLILLVAWAVLRPDVNCGSLSDETHSQQKERAIRNVQRYDMLVKYLYVHTMTYQWHLYVAVTLLVIQVAVQFALCVLEILGGLHSWWLLNGNLRGACCQLKRASYTPPAGVDSPGDPQPSERLKVMADTLRIYRGRASSNESGILRSRS